MHTRLQAWEDGGYSDDLTVASKCTELQLPIYCPGYAIFPQWCACTAACCASAGGIARFICLAWAGRAAAHLLPTPSQPPCNLACCARIHRAPHSAPPHMPPQVGWPLLAAPLVELPAPAAVSWPGGRSICGVCMVCCSVGTEKPQEEGG